jgi:hypothetical protein
MSEQSFIITSSVGELITLLILRLYAPRAKYITYATGEMRYRSFNIDLGGILLEFAIIVMDFRNHGHR